MRGANVSGTVVVALCPPGDSVLQPQREKIADLTAESFALRYSNPVLSVEVAAQACTLGRRLLMRSDAPEIRDTTAAALIQHANALRVAGDHAASEASFRAAETYLRPERPDLRADLCCRRASLLRDSGRLVEAERCLVEASELLQATNDRAGQASAYMSRALLAGRQGDPHRAIDLAKKVLARVNPRSHCLLWESAMHCLVWNLLDMRKPAEAARYWQANTSLRTLEEPLLIARRSWLEGRLDQAFGRLSEALAKMLAASAVFSEAGQEYDDALLGVDLARVYHARGERRESRAIAARSLPVLERYGAAARETDACREFATGLSVWGRGRRAARRPPLCPAL